MQSTDSSPLFPQLGGGSAWMQNFYANQVVGGNREISEATLQVINQTPMFRPLQSKTVIPGPNGIIPTGLYLAGYTDPVNTDASPVPPDTMGMRGGAAPPSYQYGQRRQGQGARPMGMSTSPRMGMPMGQRLPDHVKCEYERPLSAAEVEMMIRRSGQNRPPPFRPGQSGHLVGRPPPFRPGQAGHLVGRPGGRPPPFRPGQAGHLVGRGPTGQRGGNTCGQWVRPQYGGIYQSLYKFDGNAPKLYAY
jgi:hypothetical protein